MIPFTCTICKKTKLPEHFRWHSSSGYRTECSECEKTYQRCVRCGEVKLHKEFPPEPRNATGCHSYCKSCQAAHRRDKAGADPEFYKKDYAKYRQYHIDRWAKKAESRDAVLHTCTICGQQKSGKEFRRRPRVGLKKECLECEKTVLRCTKCQQVKPHADFTPDSTLDTGRKSWCTECELAYNRKVRKTDEYKKARKSYRRRPDVREKERQYGKQYFQTEAGKAALRKYAKSGKGYVARGRRRARVADTEVDLSFDDWIAILEEFKYRCAYCGREFGQRLRPTQDHKIPLSRGGKHIRDNIVPACMRCNQVKQARTPSEAFGLLFD